MPGIKIEAWRGKKGPAQCHRCQQFRHSSHNCHRPHACVCCGEDHAAHECPRPRAEPATCANCGGPHPANYTSCPVFKREARNKRAGTVALSTKPVEKRRQPSAGPSQPRQVEEHHKGSLMAAANGPTTRGAPLPRKKKNGKKKKGKTAKAAPSTAPPAPAPAQKSSKKTPTSAPSRTQETRQGESEKACRRQLCLLQDLTKMLQQVLSAVSEGLDAAPAIRSGMASMATHME